MAEIRFNKAYSRKKECFVLLRSSILCLMVSYFGFTGIEVYFYFILFIVTLLQDMDYRHAEH